VLGEAVEDYLKAIWKLEQGGRVSTSALADELRVSAASATGMLKKLAGLRLVRHEPYHGAALTPAGRRVALEVVRHHRLLELYLMEALGLGWDEVHVEAERLEHHLSEELEARIDAALGHPTHDPHGDPIPTAELVLADEKVRSLLDLERGSSAVVSRVPGEDPALLRYLAELGLAPSRTVSVVDRAPFEGPLTVEVEGRRHAIARELASRIEIGAAA
jgi:DtxR family transcriptional regulator, Mn-dependent transcriptional regulator